MSNWNPDGMMQGPSDQMFHLPSDGGQDQAMSGIDETEHNNATNPYGNGFQTAQPPQYTPPPTSHATDYPPPPHQPFSPPTHTDPAARYQNPNAYQQQQQSLARPHSGHSSSTDRDRYGGYGHLQGDTRSIAYQEQIPRAPQQPMPEQLSRGKDSVVIKVGMVGDAQIGKTSLMVKYVEGSWDEDYIQTLGVNFMEKTISIRNTEITFSIWDLGGQREFVNMLPLVCNDAVAILFMFDLTRKSTLNSIKEWYRQGRGFNKTAIPFLVGTKYDHFVNFPREDQEEISNQARRFARAMRASLIFSSTSHSINVQKIFKIVLSKAFDLKCTIPEIEHVGEPLLLYQSVA
ncbi:MAG: hypothetical protein M1816_001001 [Peltula sp. TS41687]|nr:MAG: hypothetical protein M1816_001001 [Peltula sp. TS41687]